MADEGGGRSPLGDLFIFIVAFALLVGFYFVSGAAKRAPIQGLFVQSPISASSTHSFLPFWNPSTAESQSMTYVYGSSFSPAPSPPELSNFKRSPHSGQVAIIDYSGVRTTDPQQQYVVLYANPSNGSAVDISGW